MAGRVFPLPPLGFHIVHLSFVTTLFQKHKEIRIISFFVFPGAMAGFFLLSLGVMDRLFWAYE